MTKKHRLIRAWRRYFQRNFFYAVIDNKLVRDSYEDSPTDFNMLMLIGKLSDRELLTPREWAREHKKSHRSNRKPMSQYNRYAAAVWLPYKPDRKCRVSFKLKQAITKQLKSHPL